MIYSATLVIELACCNKLAVPYEIRNVGIVTFVGQRSSISYGRRVIVAVVMSVFIDVRPP